jgi:membrane fusion protein (multidrug efflux system)
LIKAQIAKTAVRDSFSGRMVCVLFHQVPTLPAIFSGKTSKYWKIENHFFNSRKICHSGKTNTNIITFTISDSTEKFTAKVYAIEL